MMDSHYGATSKPIRSTPMMLVVLAATITAYLVVDVSYAQTDILVDATYDWDTNKIMLNMTKPINAFTINTNHIEIRDGGCSITFSASEYDGGSTIALGSVVLVFEPNELTRAGLASMDEPRVRLEAGAFKLLDDAADIDAAETELRVTGGQSVQGSISAGTCIITYGYEQPSEDWFREAGIDADNAGAVRAAIRDGFEAWAEINEHLSFEEVDINPDVVIRWMNFDGEHLGAACFDCIGGAYIDIVLHDVDCRGVAVALRPDTIRNTLAYQLGHNLGLPHTTDGLVDYRPHTFGYNIPKLAESAPPTKKSNLTCVTYGYEQSPKSWFMESGISTSHAKMVSDAVQYGFDAWSKLNPNMYFEEVDSNPTITIRWTEFTWEHVGFACLDCIGDDAYIAVVTHKPDCRGDPVVFGMEMMRNTVAHEFGHNIGLEHHRDETHLMYGTKDVQHPYETLGYAIPKLLDEYLVGERLLESEHLRLEGIIQNMEDELAGLEHNLTNMKDELDALRTTLDNHRKTHASSISDNTAYFDNYADLNRAKYMVSEYKILRDKYNMVWDNYETLYNEYSDTHDEYSLVIDKLNCIHE